MEVVIGPYRAVRHQRDEQSAPVTGLWHGEDLRTGDEVSLTMLPPGMLELAREEIALADPVGHPHLLTVIDVVHEDEVEQAALVAPWPAGGLLADLLARRGPLTAAEALTVLIPLADALCEAHRADIRHGGICPEVIWFDGFGRPLLGPLAVSRVASAQNRGFPVGIRDVAPELVRGETVRHGPISLAADVFSLGSVALACLTGRSAWPADDPADVLVQSAAGLWPDPPDDAAPPDFIGLIRDMLASSPDRRPGAADVAARLARVGVPQPVRFADRQPGQGELRAAAILRHGSAPPEPVVPELVVPELVVPKVVVPDLVVPEPGSGASDGSVSGTEPQEGRQAVRSVTHSGTSVDRPGAESPVDPNELVGSSPVDRPGGLISRLRAATRRSRRPAGQSGRRGGRGSGPPSGQPGPPSAQAQLRELMRRGLPSEAAAANAGDSQGAIGRLTPLARTGVILLAGVLVTLVALQVSVWWEGGSATVVNGGSEAAADGGAFGASTDWAAVVKDLDTARGRALAAADPALLADVYGEGTPEIQADEQTIQRLADQGLRVVDGVHQIVSVTVLGSAPGGSPASTPSFVTTADPAPPAGSATISSPGRSTAGPTVTDTVRLAVVDTLPAHPIVDTGGQQVGVTESRAEQRRVLVVSRTEAGFRIVGVERG
jgi:serine/threonine protein kinase